MMYDNLIFLSLRFCPKFCFQILIWNFCFSKQRSVCTFPSTLSNTIKNCWFSFKRSNTVSLHSMIILRRIKCSIENITWVQNSSWKILLLFLFLFCLFFYLSIFLFDILSANNFFCHFLQHTVIMPNRNSFWRHKYADNSNISGYFTSRELPENVKKVFV